MGESEDAYVLCGFLAVTWLPVVALGVYVDPDELTLGFALGAFQIVIGDFRSDS